MAGDEEGQLEGLLLVEPGVAEAGVVGGQVVLVEPLAAAEALGDGVAGELEVDAAEVAPLLVVDAQGLLELRVDVVEAAGLDAGVGGEGVAVHGVALPDHGAAVLGVLDGADVLGQEVADAGGAVAGYEGDLTRLAGRVEGAEEGEDVGGWGRGADFYADGVGDAAEELDVGVVDLARAVADPEEVRRGVVVLLYGAVLAGDDAAAVVLVGKPGRGGGGGDAGLGRDGGEAGPLEEAGEGLLVLEQEALVAGEELDGLEPRLARVDDAEEAEGLLDAGGDGRVALLDGRVADVAEAPVEGLVEVGDARGDAGADEVERGGGVVVGSFGCVSGQRRVFFSFTVALFSLSFSLLHESEARRKEKRKKGMENRGGGGEGISLDQPLGVQLPLVDVVPVEYVAPEAGHLPAVDDLGRAAPGLGVLAGHAADADDALVGAPDEDEAHLQQQLDLGLDGALAAVVEELGAVAALQEEGVPRGHVGEVGPEALHLVRVHQGRQPGELGHGGGEAGGVGVRGALLDGLCAPRGRVPFLVLLLGSHCD